MYSCLAIAHPELILSSFRWRQRRMPTVDEEIMKRSGSNWNRILNARLSETSFSFEIFLLAWFLYRIPDLGSKHLWSDLRLVHIEDWDTNENLIQN